jgi:hypothetical protein
MLRERDAWFAGELGIDYDIDVDRLYARAFELLFRHDRRLKALELCVSSGADLSRRSWTIDLSQPETGRPAAIGGQYSDLYCEATNIKLQDNLLEVRGIIDDSVDLAKAFEFNYRGVPGFNEIMSIKAIVATMIEAEVIQPTNVSVRAIVLAIAEAKVQEHCYYTSEKQLCTLEDLVTAFCEIYTTIRRAGYRFQKGDWEAEVNKNEHWFQLLEILRFHLHQRTLIRTEKGRYGLAPSYTQNGDVIAILLGLENPAILRRQAGSSYKYIGASFVHGLNWGEGLVGALPEQLCVIRRQINDFGGSNYIFEAALSGNVIPLDPRLQWAEMVLSKQDIERDPLLLDHLIGDAYDPKKYFSFGFEDRQHTVSFLPGISLTSFQICTK